MILHWVNDLYAALWAPAPPGRGAAARWAVQAGRVVDRLVDDIQNGRLNLYAMSLVYTTLLSIVPVLAVAFSVLKGFGVHNQIEPTLRALLAPLGPEGADIARQVIEFVENIEAGVLGALGLGMLVYTVISLMQKIEGAFNFIWDAHGQRSLARRFSDYLSVILVGPVLIFAALGITGSAMSSDVVQWLAAHEPARTLVVIAGRVVPFMLVVAAFTFIYTVVPYTRVNLKAAFAGAVVAGVLWHFAGLVFASFIATSGRYAAIYSGFAIGILAMIWLYLAWLVLLVGCRIAFYWQYPQYLRPGDSDASMLSRKMEALALHMMIHVGRRYRRREGGVDASALAGGAGATRSGADSTIGRLVAARLLVPAASGGPAYLPAAPLDQITVADILNAARGNAALDGGSPVNELVKSVIEGFEASAGEALRGQTLDDLVRAVEAPDSGSLTPASIAGRAP